MDQCKTCASCRESKPTESFHRSSRRKDGREPYCKVCRKAMHQGLDPRVPDPARVDVPPGEKFCARCRTCKPVAGFPPGEQWKDGLFPYCRDCKRSSQREDHAKHKVQRNAGMRERYAADSATHKARARAQYERDREAGKRRAREWAKANPARRLEIRQASFRKAWAANPERFREAWRKRQAAIRRGCAVYPFTTEQLAAKVGYWGSRCWVCSGPWDSIDHVKPLAKLGPHMLANLRPICTPCNTRKRDRWPFLAA